MEVEKNSQTFRIMLFSQHILLAPSLSVKYTSAWMKSRSVT